MNAPVKRTPESDTNEFLRELAEQGTALQVRQTAPRDAAPTTQQAFDVTLPEVVVDVLRSPERDELIAVARTLRQARREPQSIVFHLQQGDIKCRYMWANVRLDALTGDQMYVIKLRSVDMVFTPKPGTVLDIRTEPSGPAVSVVCLAAPLPIYPGIDLLCFMLHNDPMQKDGKLKEDAPSVVSGKPSTRVVNGEPVAEGEQPVATTTRREAPVVKSYDEPRQS